MESFYICETCGYWTSISFVQSLNLALAPLMRSPYSPQEGVLCPSGHGAMRLVRPDDKLQFRLTEQEPEEQPLSRYKVLSDLKRLKSYYGDRARIAGKHARECVDQQSMCDKAHSASRFEAKHDTVVKVAENLGIVLEEEKIEEGE